MVQLHCGCKRTERYGVNMTLGNKIAAYRKQRDMTQEVLAKKLEVSNQAVSKWEADLCCPAVLLLPKIADIFDISMDELFDRRCREKPGAGELPWEDDGVLRAVLYVGKKLVGGHEAREKITFCYEGPALNVQSEFSVTCGDVSGNVNAGGSVNCDDVGGDVRAGGNVTCDDVDGSVSAGGDVTCDTVDGSVRAGCNVTCDEIAGNVSAGCNVYCDHIGE